MKTLLEFLQESLDSAYEWKIKHDRSSYWSTSFMDSENRKYNVICLDPSGNDEWTIEFITNMSHANTNYGDPFRVLSTVVEILLTFLKTYKPKKFRFIGNKKYGKFKLYSVLVKKYASDIQEIGYEQKRFRDQKGEVFRFVQIDR